MDSYASTKYIFSSLKPRRGHRLPVVFANRRPLIYASAHWRLKRSGLRALCRRMALALRAAVTAPAAYR